jgi:hypothetical protein
MWGNMPALDVLNLERNEGFEEGRDYTLLFAGKTDTPNLVPAAELSLPPVISETWCGLLQGFRKYTQAFVL